MTKTESYFSTYQVALGNLAVQLVSLAIEAQHLAALRLVALASGQASAAEEMSIAFSETVSAWHEGNEIIIQSLSGRRHDFGLAAMLQLFRKKLRAGERRLKATGHTL